MTGIQGTAQGGRAWAARNNVKTLTFGKNRYNFLDVRQRSDLLCRLDSLIRLLRHLLTPTNEKSAK